MAAEARSILRVRFATPPRPGLKSLLASAPLEDVVLDRPRDMGREIDLLKYLLDTNVISELRKEERCNYGVSAWYATVTDDDLCLSCLVLGEIRKGLECLKSRDTTKARALEVWLGDVTAAFGDRALPVDAAVTDVRGRLNGMRPVPVIDGLLTATAMVLTLVTHNAADVKGLGASVLNPFT